MTDIKPTEREEGFREGVLLPCPFCGSPPILHIAVEGHQPVECSNAECCMSRMWPDIAAWNCRALTPPSDGTTELLQLWAECERLRRDAERQKQALIELKVLFEKCSEERYQELMLAQKEAAKWKSEGDMYGWNYHQGKAGGMNEADIIYCRLKKAIDAASAEGGR